ncbi:hypothetical protein QTP86_020386 [Hemibagrus guttatus]|nr:hypothetical protein QTP86_020386 [Hemibagrus guttatus]
MKVSRSKTEYMCVNEREGSGTVRLQGEEVKKVQEFKYLGSTVQSNGEYEKEVKKRVQAETVSLRKRQESELEVAELKMLRFSLGVTRLDRIRNKFIRGTAHVGRLGEQRKGRELADVMERRKVDILCVQETRWKGSKARSIGAGFKLFYYGVDRKRNGAGVVLKEEFVRNVLEVGCELEEKERFWSELDEVTESIPTGERVVIGVDFNGHVDEGNRSDEEVMGKFGVKERNLEGQMVVDFTKRMDMAVKVEKIRKDEVRKAWKRMKSGKAVGPDDIPVEVWKCLGEAAVEFLTSLFNKVLENEKMPEEWRSSVLVPIFKNTSDVQSFSN